MAKRVESVPFNTQGGKFPWSDWLDGSIWEITADDLAGTPEGSFRSQLSFQAKKRGVVASCNKSNGSFYIQAKPGRAEGS